MTHFLRFMECKQLCECFPPLSISAFYYHPMEGGLLLPGQRTERNRMISDGLTAKNRRIPSRSANGKKIEDHPFFSKFVQTWTQKCAGSYFLKHPSPSICCLSPSSLEIDLIRHANDIKLPVPCGRAIYFIRCQQTHRPRSITLPFPAEEDKFHQVG